MPEGTVLNAGRRRLRAVRQSVPPLLPVIWLIGRRALVASYRHNALGNAKSAAYSALLAFFPLLATTAAILVRLKAELISDALYNFLSEALPPGTQDLVFDYFVTKGKQPVLLPITAMIVSVWAGSGAMVSLMQGFHAAYRVPIGRSFLRERLIAIALVFSAAIPVLFASGFIFFGAHVERWIGAWLGVVPQGEELRGWVSVVGGMVRYLIALGSLVLGTAILYFVGPNRPQRWWRVWPGAVVATVLWLGATLVFAWYARHLANYNVVYGSIATVILLLVWMYLLAIIAYVGCEFNAEWEKEHGEA